MKNYIRYMLSLALLVEGTHTWAYEETTHQVLTQYAVMQSALYKDALLLSDLGFSLSGPYRTSEGQSGDVATVTALGARIEDHGGVRSVFHFFDPQYKNFQGRGLQPPALDLATYFVNQVAPSVNQITPSPDWSIEDRGEVKATPTLHQEFSYRNGQHNLYRALTGGTPDVRHAAASAMFQTLGHVVHHIQDMAQPQHVRNDQHVHWKEFLNDTKWSFYERHTEELNRTKIPGYICGNAVIAPDQCVTNYPVRAPYFPTARQYWHTPGTQSARFIGMADFTAQNYVSYGTSYYTPVFGDSPEIQNHPEFPLPSGFNRDGSTKKFDSETVSLKLVDGSTFQGKMSFLKGSIYDEYLNTVIPDKKLASPSFLNDWYLTKGLWRWIFTENSLTYEDAYGILLPRAVAFSTGLINHFFRGRIDLRKNPSGAGWQIANKTQLPLHGGFSIYAEDSAGNRKQVYPEFFAALGGGQSHALNFTEPTGNVVKLIVAFRGKIGDEGDETLASGYYAVAGKVISYSPPPPPEIVIVGASAINSQPNSRRAFRWSSKTGVRNLGVGAGALTSEAFGISANGQVVVGITTGYKAIYCDACTSPWSGTNPGPTSTILDVAVRWSGNYAAYYLNGNASTYSAAWAANADGSQIYGEGLVPNAGVKSFRWNLYRYEQIYTTSGVFSKNPLKSADGTIVLTKVNNRAAYIKGGETHIIPLPSGHDWSVANHVIVVP